MPYHQLSFIMTTQQGSKSNSVQSTQTLIMNCNIWIYTYVWYLNLLWYNAHTIRASLLVYHVCVRRKWIFCISKTIACQGWLVSRLRIMKWEKGIISYCSGLDHKTTMCLVYIVVFILGEIFTWSFRKPVTKCRDASKHDDVIKW